MSDRQGELTLRGRVTKVGGIQEKLIGALRAGVKTVILPAQNRKDVKDVPQEVKDGLEVFYVKYLRALPAVSARTSANCLSATHGKPLGTSGPTPTSPASGSTPTSKAACRSRRI